jgi:peptidoglycan/LPS O-acetylase OafA/YrhL
MLVIVLIWLGGVLHLPELSFNDEATLHGMLYINPLARLFEFTTGMVTYLAFQKFQSVFNKLNHIVFSFLELFVIIVAGYLISHPTFVVILSPCFQGAGMQWLGHTSNMLVFPLVIIVFAFGRGWLARFFGSPPMIFLGEISFSVYLVHATVFGFYSKHWQIDKTSPDYLRYAICVAATLALAFMIWAFIEVPCRTVAKRWLRNGPEFLSYPLVSKERA